VRVALLGATGYAGAEVLRLLVDHPEAEVVYVSSEHAQGRTLASVLPQFSKFTCGCLTLGAHLPQRRPLSTTLDPVGISVAAEAAGVPRQNGRLVQMDADRAAPVPGAEVDVVISALGAGELHKYANEWLGLGARMIDLSGDQRLPGPTYESWYGKAYVPLSAGMGAELAAVYGLPELLRDRIGQARVVANPGCFAVCAQLALLPLAAAGWLEGGSVCIDAKSGVTGAGRTPKPETHFAQVAETIVAYRVGAHQHTPEIEQGLAWAQGAGVTSARPFADAGSHGYRDVESSAGGAGPRVLLTTHLAPMRRGIYLSACFTPSARVTGAQLQQTMESYYDANPFVEVLPAGASPDLRQVIGTNRCQLSAHFDARTGVVLVLACIDNLGRGAAGQAVQNLNIMFGLDERFGLQQQAWL
jgi:N-acetyl-gamma-glutamyl-phosphate reductase